MTGANVTPRRSLFGLAAAVSVFAAACAGTPQVTELQRGQARAAYEQGVSFLGKNEWAGALTALQRAAMLHPRMPIYRNALGIAQLQFGQPAAALAEFQGAVAVDPEYAEAHLNAGIALAELRRWDEAVTAYQRAIGLPRLGTPGTAHHNLGVALFHLRRYPEAETAFRFAVDLDPSMQAGWYHLGYTIAAQGRKDDAKIPFRKARDLEPGSPIGQAAVQHLKALGDGG